MTWLCSLQIKRVLSYHPDAKVFVRMQDLKSYIYLYMHKQGYHISTRIEDKRRDLWRPKSLTKINIKDTCMTAYQLPRIAFIDLSSSTSDPNNAAFWQMATCKGDSIQDTDLSTKPTHGHMTPKGQYISHEAKHRLACKWNGDTLTKSAKRGVIEDTIPSTL